MREIKFRAWDKKEKKMYNARPVWIMSKEGEYSIKCFGDANCSRYMHKEDFILMQYTGLKDKNGKEIFEGDIALHPGLFSNGKPGVIRFSEIDASFYWSGKNSLPINNNHITIIGNIYENPELLHK